MIICKNIDIVDKACKHYKPTEKPKIGLCMLNMKNTFLCHYSEKVLGCYNGDAPILTSNEMLHSNR